MLHLTLFDSDVFGYTLWQNGRRVDGFDSDPDYSGEPVPAARRRRLAGRPEAFADLLDGDPARVTRLRGVLHGTGPRPVFAEDALEAFAAALGIANPLTSHADLTAGETDGVEGWEEFIHVPDESSELAQRAAHQEEIAAERQRLRAEGVLRRILLPPEAPDRWNPISPLHVVTGNEVLLAWRPLHGKSPVALLRLSEPWDEGSTTVGCEVNYGPHHLHVSPSGRYLGVGNAFGNWSAEVRDLAEGGRVCFRVEHAEAPDWVGFDPHEKVFS